MRALPVLEDRRDALEKCVFCPKLCRSACPVSNAEPRETITPWGKMSLAWMAAHGDVPIDGSHAAPAWACTGCFACREACDHRNVVADVLFETRDALAQMGVAPTGARRAVARFLHHDARVGRAARRLNERAEHLHLEGRRPPRAARVALVVGCAYLRAAPREAEDALLAASSVAAIAERSAVDVVDACCGLPLLHAGDAQGFAMQAREVARSLARYERVLVADAGCAQALRHRYPRAGVVIEPRLETLVEAAAAVLDRLGRVDAGAERVRWHDPCQLGRGLGVYEAPRLVLTRALGRAPEELEERREDALCSGGGGLLPTTMPDTARGIADARIAAHARAGGGRVVTACASSLLALRRAARRERRATGAVVAVDDLVTWIARALAPAGRSPSRGPAAPP
ncbi:MAG TPA: (Fe-S)-binding protein [Polyangiaceae bacterium]|jgi:Fe-S oxidoreductase|nr:(Fe-S)-binding protein [Polyangiaceae bacterium]